MYTEASQIEYQTLLINANTIVQNAKRKAESQLNTVLSEYKRSTQRGEAAVNVYNEYEKDYDAASAMEYYLKNYLILLLTSYKDFGKVDRFNSEWHQVYARIKSDLSAVTREKISLERNIQDMCIKGHTPSTGQMNTLSDLDDEVNRISACKTFHEKLFDLAFNYNSQVPRLNVGDIVPTIDVGGNSYIAMSKVTAIVTKDKLSTACPTVTLDSVLSTLPDEYNNPNPDFTMFYVVVEPTTYGEPTTDPNTGETIPGPPNPSVYHIMWDEMLYGH